MILELFQGIIKKTTIRVNYTKEKMSKITVTSMNFQKVGFPLPIKEHFI